MIKPLLRMSSLVLMIAGLGFNAARMAAQSASQAAAAKPPVNRLVTAKLICVSPMMDGMDQWILEDLRAWGKYRVTGDPEGADLVMRAYRPEKEPKYVLRQGVPQPKKERREPPAVQITVVDWISNEAVWQADIIDRKPKKDEPDPSPGPVTEVYARGLKPDELAAKVARKFRQYVDGLEPNGR